MTPSACGLSCAALMAGLATSTPQRRLGMGLLSTRRQHVAGAGVGFDLYDRQPRTRRRFLGRSLAPRWRPVAGIERGRRG
jgi:hypothetical protein